MTACARVSLDHPTPNISCAPDSEAGNNGHFGRTRESGTSRIKAHTDSYIEFNVEVTTGLNPLLSPQYTMSASAGDAGCRQKRMSSAHQRCPVERHIQQTLP